MALAGEIPARPPGFQGWIGDLVIMVTLTARLNRDCWLMQYGY